MILADQGADVIKVEPPGRGDFTPQRRQQEAVGFAASFLNNNRNKRSIAVDLLGIPTVSDVRQAPGRKPVDVLVQNFRPGVVERLGIGEDGDPRRRSPASSMSRSAASARRAPSRTSRSTTRSLQALSGLASIQGGADSERPRLVRTILPDKLTCDHLLRKRSTAALLARERTGVGQHVRLSMVDRSSPSCGRPTWAAQTYVGQGRQLRSGRRASST